MGRRQVLTPGLADVYSRARLHISQAVGDTHSPQGKEGGAPKCSQLCSYRWQRDFRRTWSQLFVPSWGRKGGRRSVAEKLGDTLGSRDLGGTVGLTLCFTVIWGSTSPKQDGQPSTVTAVRRGKLSQGLGKLLLSLL